MQIGQKLWGATSNGNEVQLITANLVGFNTRFATLRNTQTGVEWKVAKRIFRVAWHERPDMALRAYLIEIARSVDSTAAYAPSYVECVERMRSACRLLEVIEKEESEIDDE